MTADEHRAESDRCFNRAVTALVVARCRWRMKRRKSCLPGHNSEWWLLSAKGHVLDARRHLRAARRLEMEAAEAQLRPLGEPTADLSHPCQDCGGSLTCYPGRRWCTCDRCGGSGVAP